MSLKGKKVLVTGGAGFLGSHLCERLVSEGADVRIIDTFASGRKENISSFQDRLTVIEGNLNVPNTVVQAAAGVDTVIHTAFPMEIREQKYSLAHLRFATDGFFNLLEACLRGNAVFIQISSVAVYGNPQYTPVDENHPLEPETLYGAVKIAEEYYCRMLAKNRGLKAVILRVSDIYGPRNTRMSVPINFLLKAMSNQPITVFGEGTQGRTYTFITDFVDAVLLAMCREHACGEAINVASGNYVSMNELARAVASVVGQGVVVFEPKIESDSRTLDININKAKTLLGYVPKIILENGLKKTWNWIKDNPGFYKSFSFK